MIQDTALIGWLCFIDYQLEHENIISLPPSVRAGLVERGWLTIDEDADWDGHRNCAFTAAGEAKSDIESPDWGIESLPVGSN